MVIQNIGGKIVNIGTNLVMPEEELTVSDATAAAPAVKALERRGFIRIVDHPAAVLTETVETAAETAASEAATTMAKTAAAKTATEASAKAEAGNAAAEEAAKTKSTRKKKAETTAETGSAA